MADQTPMMQQYKRIKSQNSDAILFFRLGDFYEMFDRDAKEVSHLLNLTLTKRNGIPMCGIPYHAANSYIPRLLRAGKKIAICEQTTAPEKGKGIVEREVIEIVTPGTITEEEYLDQHKNNYLVSIGAHPHGIALCYIDISTGECAVRDFPFQLNDELLREELSRLDPTEVLLQESLLEQRDALARFFDGKSHIVLNRYPDWTFDASGSYEHLLRFFGVQNLKGFGFEANDAALSACGVLFEYIEENAKHAAAHIRSIRRIQSKTYVGIDEATQKNLELVANMSDRSRSYTLLEVIDHTRTAMGARTLRSRLLHPLRDLEPLEQRLHLVELFYKDQMTLSQLRSRLAGVRDIERLTSRIALEKAHAKDLLAICHSLEQVRELSGLLPPEAALEELDEASFDYATIDELIALLENSIHEDPSIYLSEGRLIRDGYSRELDELRELKQNSTRVLEEYLASERQESGISNLKIKYNKIIGHFLEVTKSNLDRVPDHFIRRQSLVGSERYTTNRLNELEERLNNAAEQIVELEKELFLSLRSQVRTYIDQLLAVSKSVGALDCLQSLAYAATVHGWRKPNLNRSSAINIKAGRHPVVEYHDAPGSFIPNSIRLDSAGKSFALITGPNMSGKSTFLRQTALIVLLGQIGSFVPAEEADIGLVDRIFCRVGASDNLARGESTFLVEMNETAYILHSASEHSLVIMDEVGRGTSTHDGLSIAWAVSEYLLQQHAKTLFATHYHELTALESDAIINLFLEVKEDQGEIVFLKKVREGNAGHSYGLHVAKLAGLPESVLSRAAEILSSLGQRESSLPAVQMNRDADGATESGGASSQRRSDRPKRAQSSLFDPSEMLLAEIRQTDVNSTTPMDALKKIARWKSELEAE
ncbi:MAG: DNA mismatch repair protein MutS [Spirochaetia bacterium]